MALALQQLLLFFLVSFLYAAQPLVAHSHNHRTHDKIHQVLHEHHVRRNASSLASNGTAAAVPGSAEDIIARFQQAMAVANQAILEAPKENVPQVQNSTTRRRKRTKAQPLDYSGDFHQHANGTVFRRGTNGTTVSGSNSNSTTFTRESYTVPPEVAEAARILAEANPLPPADYDVLLADVRARMAKRKVHLNDTNMMPQKMQRPSGLVEYVPPAELAITVQNGTQVAGPEHPVDDYLDDTDEEADPSAKLAKRAATTFWMETMTQRGSAPYAPAGYKVWRNVKDYGAYGDGIHDDTAAINLAISEGGRCGAGCPASTQFPATVYFPAGTYLVSSPIIQLYNTEMLGDPFNPPVILAAESFSGLGVITSDVYVDDDVTWYLNQNNFLRSVRNFVMDIRPTPQWAYVCAIHWQVAQGTSLENIAFISTTPAEYEDTTHQGIYMENGSGGFMSDLVFVGGNFGAYFGNQQFTTSGLLFDSCRTGLQIHWDWGWTMQDTEFYNCRKGIVIVGGAGGPFSTGQGVGSLSLVDVHMWGVPVVVETSLFADNSTALHISNGGFENCATIVLDSQTNTVLYPGNAAGLTNVMSWGFGKVADPSGETGFMNGADMPAPDYPASLLVSDDIHPRAKFFHRTRPSYADPGNSQIFDVKALGAKGDGTTDDTAILNRILDVAANVSGIVYFPHGIYIIKDTLEVPVGSRIIGQAWPQIMATGAQFQDMANPRAAVRVGAVGSVGVMEIQCVMFTVRGPTAGAVLVEWNVHESTQGSAGLWDSHIRVGGAKGSDLQKAECPKTVQNKGCIAASMMMHMTEKSSGYLENVWMWVADHDMEDADQIQINVYAARGILIESQGPTWLWGTAAEHAVLYQYQLSGAKNVVMGLIQTEAPYFQPSPKAPAPFEKGLVFKDDPTFADCPANSKTCAMAWSLRMVDSTNVYVISGGLYTWFQDYSQDCVNSGANDCQLSTFYVEQSYDVWIYNLITIGAIQMITPLNGQPVIAINNRNGFASSIVTWLGGANQTVGGRNITGYTLYTRDDLASYGFSEQCKTALTATLACVDQTMQWTSPAYRGSLGNATLQDEVCDVGCRSSLASWYQGVSTSCADYTWNSGAPLEMAGGYVWYGYNESCLTDTSTGRYCNDVIDEFSETETLDGMPNSELCSGCFTARVRMMQKSTYSVYNTVPWYQMALEAIQARCSLQVPMPTEVPPPLIVVPTPEPFCVSGNYYTAQAGDTCNSIALANDVSSANVFYAATAAGSARGCSDLPAGLTICLPLTCMTYLVKSTDNCFTASASAGIDDIAVYNSWIDDGCDNLHEANATLGSVLCASPLGGTYIPGTATNTSGIPGGGMANYSSVAVDPPTGATVAPRTVMECGRWYVAQQDDTCAYITMTYSIGLSLFAKMNPSIDAKTSGGCSASIIPGYAYCMSPVFNPYAGSSNRTYTTKPFGCWSNLDNSSQVLLGSIWTDGTMTLDTCAKACFTDGFTLAGFSGSDTCLCGDQVSINSVQLSTSTCATNQDNALSLYGLSSDDDGDATLLLTFQFTDVGCFANSALITGSGPSATWATNNTVGNCASLCGYAHLCCEGGSVAEA
ncbi:pectate lyase superfamily protein-domain-containing protein [Phialemonium atrogriseum]|uniref:Pectate lyase superfamily protein-domain-containing protein n=1 Tax=Phialemonium atrogriseum TaxID=1093897 RepID=A0AAJ0FGS6_9PEZI|nr:pectate lyase superfamily protein-domain-containing protein [Phialemonium atrogriseum]KAK1767906.1 pectate lyase superfamily protein-domain-containing protein [Phialemonium atrogriseum]